MTERTIGKKAERTLGEAIKRKRMQLGMSLLQLGRAVNQKQQQIDKYESGEFVPLSVLEAIAVALGEPIPKRTIRQISFIRKTEIETGVEQDELTEIYTALFDDPAE